MAKKITKLNGIHQKKAEELSKNVDALTFRLQKAIRNLRYCRKECRDTSKEIGELNDRYAENS